MNYCFNWLIIRAYRNGLIGREKFVSLWETVQALSEERKQSCFVLNSPMEEM